MPPKRTPTPAKKATKVVANMASQERKTPVRKGRSADAESPKELAGSPAKPAESISEDSDSDDPAFPYSFEAHNGETGENLVKSQEIISKKISIGSIQSLVQKLLPTTSKFQVTEEQYLSICAAVVDVLKEEPNMKTLSTPISICGDLHGQFTDVQKLFAAGGNCPEKNYLFLGDYVDRGDNSINTMALLLALKVLYPNNITLLRGNHECEMQTNFYGFRSECINRFGRESNVWQSTINVFAHMPLAALIDSTIFCVHGGISKSFATIDQIDVTDRTIMHSAEDQTNPFSELLWSDPCPYKQGFSTSYRGVGHRFGKDVFDKFMEDNKLTLLVRGHELAKEGYAKEFDGRLITVWSAPNYCGFNDNKACIMEINEKHDLNFVFFGDQFKPKPKASDNWGYW